MCKKTILFDTNFIRGVIHNDKDAVKYLKRFKKYKHKVNFKLHEIAVVEIALALLEERVDFSEWKMRIGLFNNILDPEMPILPGGNEFAQLANLEDTTESKEVGGLEFYKCLWMLMNNLNSKDHLINGDVFTLKNGDKIRIGINVKKSKEVIESAKETWIKFIDNMRKLIAGNSISQEQIIKLIKSDLDKDGKNRSNKLDAMASVLGRYIYLSVTSNNPYNPNSEKRSGDIFDFNSLMYLSIDTIICTYDKKFQQLVKLSNSSQSDRVLSPEEVFKLLKSSKNWFCTFLMNLFNK